MNVAEASGFLEERLKDLGGNKFTAEIRRILLQQAEIYLANLLEPTALTELEDIEESVSVTSGAALLSLLTYDVLGGAQGILRVTIAGGKICRRLDPDKLKETESYFRGGSTDDPMYWVENGTIYLLPTTVASIDVKYRKMPPALYFSFTSDEADSGSSTTKFDGAADEGLNATTPNHYNGAVIYNEELGTYHVVTAYDEGSLEFTVEPAAASAFSDGQNFKFITNGFDSLSLDSVDFALNEGVHTIILSLAESFALAQTNLDSQRVAAENRAATGIAAFNENAVKTDDLGT